MGKIQKLMPAGLERKTVLDGQLLYSQVIVADPGQLVFVSGQLARDVKGEVVAPGDMRRQIEVTGENLKIALEAAGCSLADLVKITTYVTDMKAFFKHIDVRQRYFGAAVPTSTTVEVRALAHPDLMVEIEAWAIKH